MVQGGAFGGGVQTRKPSSPDDDLPSLGAVLPYVVRRKATTKKKKLLPTFAFVFAQPSSSSSSSHPLLHHHVLLLSPLRHPFAMGRPTFAVGRVQPLAACAENNIIHQKNHSFFRSSERRTRGELLCTVVAPVVRRLEGWGGGGVWARGVGEREGEREGIAARGTNLFFFSLYFFFALSLQRKQFFFFFLFSFLYFTSSLYFFCVFFFDFVCVSLVFLLLLPCITRPPIFPRFSSTQLFLLGVRTSFPRSCARSDSPFASKEFIFKKKTKPQIPSKRKEWEREGEGGKGGKKREARVVRCFSPPFFPPPPPLLKTTHFLVHSARVTEEGPCTSVVPHFPPLHTPPPSTLFSSVLHTKKTSQIPLFSPPDFTHAHTLHVCGCLVASPNCPPNLSPSFLQLQVELRFCIPETPSPSTSGEKNMNYTTGRRGGGVGGEWVGQKREGKGGGGRGAGKGVCVWRKRQRYPFFSFHRCFGRSVVGRQSPERWGGAGGWAPPKTWCTPSCKYPSKKKKRFTHRFLLSLKKNTHTPPLPLETLKKHPLSLLPTHPHTRSLSPPYPYSKKIPLILACTSRFSFHAGRNQHRFILRTRFLSLSLSPPSLPTTSLPFPSLPFPSSLPLLQHNAHQASKEVSPRPQILVVGEESKTH